ncbi:helix-turn-helix domain-containing protein [Peribacillus frigoritolerans]|nr:helix-turn-helix domain-containing protein [Peribacillus frigoritolerans]
MSDQALRLLRLYKWPGNIRELENIIERAMNIVEEGEMICSQHLPKEITGYKEAVSIRTLAEVMDETERAAIVSCLEMTSGNKSETAKRLGVSRNNTV